MNYEIKEYLKSLVGQEINQFEDNMNRAKAVVKQHDPNLKYGESGQTLNEIIQGYQNQLHKANLAMDYLKGLDKCRWLWDELCYTTSCGNRDDGCHECGYILDEENYIFCPFCGKEMEVKEEPKQ